MEHWEFLIQKQGDRYWRPLESPNVEIMEGKYRVVARSHHANLDVDVRVTHESTLEVPSKRRIQKRSRRTNRSGLMAVIPFTYLKPGIWELQCSGDLMSDILGTSWQYSVYLQVLPILGSKDEGVGGVRGDEGDEEVGGDEGDKGDGKVTSSSSSSPSSSLFSSKGESENEEKGVIIDEPVSPVWLKAETAEQILKNLIELALPPSEPLLEDETTVEDSPAISDLPLLLTLEEETYVAYWGKTLTINGYLEPKQTINQVLDETSKFERVCAGELRIELCSPQESQTLTQVRQPLPAKLLPFTIKCSIEIPSDWETKLILADISLYGALAGAGETKLLADKSFTITADVTQLLAISAAANNSEPNTLDPIESPASPVAPPSVPLKLELFNLVKTAKTIQYQHFRPSPKKSLPPEIYPLTLRKSAASPSSPQLPKFSRQKTKTISVATVVLESPTQLHLLKNDDTTAMSRFTSIGTTFPYLRRLKALPSDREGVKSNQLNVLMQKTFENSQNQATEDYHEDAHKLVAYYTQFSENSFEDAHELVVNDAQSQENSFAEVVVPPSSELTTMDSPYVSPLIKKWMHSQGYSLPEPINLQHQDYEDLIPNHETMSSELLDQPLVTDLATDVVTDVTDVVADVTDVVTDLATDVVTDVTDVATDLVTDVTDVITKLTDLTDELWLGFTDQPSVTSATTSVAGNPPSPSHTQTPSAILAREIVVYDTYSDEADTFKNHPSKEQSQPVSHVSVITEPLAIPQLHLPNGELISGNSVRVFVQVADRRPQVAVKLWVEDCQTRWLLDGPRLLTNLLPNSLGGLEVMTHISVPFGCQEIRVEAIAIDMVTQQESHKVTILRTVIPEDLPNLPLDELLLSI